MNFKRGYKKDKKLINYGSPKEFQQNHVIRKVVKRKGRKKLCKFYKGSHKFEVVSVKISEFWPEKMTSLKCKCGKEDWKYEKI